jgi:hypothetical protein
VTKEKGGYLMGVLTRGGFRRRLILLAAALALGIASVIILPIGSSRADVPVEEAAGVLLLRVDSDGDSWVRYYADPVSPLNLDAYDEQQLIDVSNKCAVSEEDGSLLAISEPDETPHGVGAVSNGLGVRSKNNCSTAQGRISPSQSLTFTLGTSSDLPDDVVIKSVEVDVEAKFNAGLGYSLDGSAQDPVPLPNTSDNGPDSGVGDNNIVRIAPEEAGLPSYFDSIEFFASNDGEVAIEGGGDGPVTTGDLSPLRDSLGVNETVFELVTVTEYDGIISCGEPTDPVGGEGTPLARLTRGSDDILLKQSGGDCTQPPIGYNLSSSPMTDGEQTISFEFEEDLLPSWVGQFTWAPEPFPTDPETGDPIGVPVTRVDEDGDGPLLPEALVWCNGFTGETDPEITDPELVDETGVFQIPRLPDDRSWCLISQETTVVGANSIQVTQTVYGLTDPFWARG